MIYFVTMTLQKAISQNNQMQETCTVLIEVESEATMMDVFNQAFEEFSKRRPQLANGAVLNFFAAPNQLV